jgi:Spy/CpxP family protein refolding chaperone
MKTISTRKLVALAAAVLVLIPLAATAQRFGHGPGGGFGPGFRMGRMAERLELTDDQLGQIRGILEARREQFEPLMAEQAQLRRELREAIHGEAYDEGLVRDVAGRLGESGVEIAVLRGRVAQEVMTVLTPEQQAEARELQQELRDGFRGGRRHGRFGRDRGRTSIEGE